MNGFDLTRAQAKALTAVKQHSYHVGDHVHYGFNGDYQPGVVVRVTDASVWVRPAQLDTSGVPDCERAYGRAFAEGDTGVVWVEPSADVPCMRFQVLHGRKWRGQCVHGGYHRLAHGALSAWNPHI